MPAALKVGFVGLDSTHALVLADAFARMPEPRPVPVAAWPGGTAGIPLSEERVARITAEFAARHHVPLVASPEEVAARSDVVLLLALPGETHAPLFARLAPWRRPMFVDKPLACDPEDARRLAATAAEAGAPWFSCSALRFARGCPTDRKRVEVRGPLLFANGNPGWYWYGIHLVEMLVAALGPGAVAARVVATRDGERMEARWADGREGVALGRADPAEVFRWIEPDGTAVEAPPAFDRLATEIVTFGAGAPAPVPLADTLGVIDLVAAANRSRGAGGEWTRVGAA